MLTVTLPQDDAATTPLRAKQELVFPVKLNSPNPRETLEIASVRMRQGPPPPSNASAGSRIPVLGLKVEWGARLQKRFDELVVLEALSEISSEQLRELEGLQIMRRRIQSPRSGSEIMREMQIQEKAAAAVLALTQFFEILCPNVSGYETKGKTKVY